MASPIVRLSSSDLVGYDRECPICLVGIKKGPAIAHERENKDQSWHAAHENCLMPWLSAHYICPICRKIIDTSDLVAALNAAKSLFKKVVRAVVRTGAIVGVGAAAGAIIGAGEIVGGAAAAAAAGSITGVATATTATATAAAGAAVAVVGLIVGAARRRIEG